MRPPTRRHRSVFVFLVEEDDILQVPDWTFVECPKKSRNTNILKVPDF